jgi:oligopeptidase B
LHGVDFNDDYFWLRDRGDPAVLEYLKAENAYTEARSRHLASLRDAIFEEIKAKVTEDDLSAPARDGKWWYGVRTEKGKQYPIYLRWEHTPDSSPHVLLDQNELAGAEGFCAVGHVLLNHSQTILAYSVDFSGGETYEMRFRDLEAGIELPDRLTGTYYGGAFSSDGGHFFYSTLDEAHRPYRAWRHRMGTPQSQDELIYEETDQRFDLEVSLSRDQTMILIDLFSNSTSETQYVPAADPEKGPEVLIERIAGVRYQSEPHRGRWLVITDQDAPNGRLVELGPDGQTELLGHDPRAKLAWVSPFADHVIVQGRKEANPVLTVLPSTGESFDIGFPDSAYRLRLGENREYESAAVRVVYESLLTPPRVIDVDLDTGAHSLVKETAVPGGYDRGRYVTDRSWAETTDGIRIPITLVHLSDLQLPAPTLLYGYGAYESVLDPDFDPAVFPLLDRGCVYAIAHVRGGGEMGRLWHLDGRMEKKINTFNDFIAAAEHLMASGVSEPGRIAARGISAGGLLMGAVTVMRPDLWAAIVAEVPFVDVINTMVDPAIPLTVAEWEEWGNPDLRDNYEYMSAYSPYDNTVARSYPAILATAGFNDPRVAYWEPAKWVAKLRAVNEGTRPILLRTELGSGHSGRSGRYDHWKDEAFILAFVLDQLGLA